MTTNTTVEESPAISPFEISRLACLNWKKDGCPVGRDLDYWLEAEKQIKATRHLPVRETKTTAARKTKFRKAESIKVWKISARPALAQ